MAGAAPQMYLNVGCGLVAPSDWVNLDSSWSTLLGRHPLLERLARRMTGIRKDAWPSGIRHWDARKGLPFAAATVDGVYASHFLEHLTRWHAEAFLRESYRVLKPGGIIRLVVPDLECLVADYGNAVSNGGRDTAADVFLDAMACCPLPDGSTWAIRRLRAWKQFNVHKWMYDEHSLTARLRTAGFVQLRRRAFMDSDIARITTVEREISFVRGLCVEGVKRP